MSRDLVTVEFATPLGGLDLAPPPPHPGAAVVDRARWVIGVVTLVDFKQRPAGPARSPEPGAAYPQAAGAHAGDYSDKAEVVGQIMTSPCTP